MENKESIIYHKTWTALCAQVLGSRFDEWEEMSRTDWETLNPILNLYSLKAMKAVRIIQHNEPACDEYAMWLKKTNTADTPDDSIGDFVFVSRLSEKSMEVFKLLFTIWANENTDYSYMVELLRRYYSGTANQ